MKNERPLMVADAAAVAGTADTIESNVDMQRVQQDRSQLELRKAQATAWYFSPPY